jgi:hypothetical protein
MASINSSQNSSTVSMPGNARKRFKKILFLVLFLFLLINLVIINQAYHFTHFYEHGTVKSVSEQTSGFWGESPGSLVRIEAGKAGRNCPGFCFYRC